VIAISSADRPVDSSSAPARSIGLRRPGMGSGRSARCVLSSAATASGRLAKNTHSHDRCSVSQPPSTGPSTLATANMLLM
jgi:hypothetical protein